MKRGRHRARHAIALAIAITIAIAPAIAAAQAYLPPEALVDAALRAQPGVQAAIARVDAAAGAARAREVGSHEFELSVIPQQRNTRLEGRYREWEAQLSRSIRLPAKARLDREIGGHLRSAAGLRLDDAEHQAARRLLELWMNGLRQALAADEA
ncbi:MAG: TolC family protein, partial [Burkholderiales bacterium]|nr:TolC family protein [Burkholderiales bacterium]